MQDEFDEVWITLRLSKGLRRKFQAAARVQSMDASNLIRQFMTQTYREIQERSPRDFEAALAFVVERENNDKAKRRTTKRAAVEPSKPKYQELPQSHLFSTGTGEPIGSKKVPRAVRKDIEDIQSDARERVRQKKAAAPKKGR